MATPQQIIEYMKQTVSGNDNRRPAQIVAGSNRPIPSYQDRVRINKQVVIHIYEVNRSEHEIARSNIQKNINEALGLDSSYEIPSYECDNKQDIEILLSLIPEAFGIELLYEQVVNELQSYSRKEGAKFYIFIPTVQSHYLD